MPACYARDMYDGVVLLPVAATLGRGADGVELWLNGKLDYDDDVSVCHHCTWQA